MTAAIHQIAELPLGPVTPDRWTAIIPAAGRGSRLGSDQPKILYPILGKPILEWLLDALVPVCRSFVLVLSPEGRSAIEPAARHRLGVELDVVIQERPTGMADAVRLAAAVTRTEFALTIWGDQVTVSPKTIAVCAALHE